MAGTSFAQFIPIITAPILSRIYTPADYGKSGVFISLCSIIGIFSTLQYSNAFLLPKKEEEFFSLVKLSLKLTLLTTAAFSIIIFALYKQLGQLLNAEDIQAYFLLIPVSIFMSGITNTLNGFANRQKAFKIISLNRVIAAVANAIVSLAFGVIYKSWIGLLTGFMINQFINSIILTITIIRNTENRIIKAIINSETRLVRKKYINFPKYSLLSDLVNNFTFQVPVFLLNRFSTSAIVGMFNICNRILGLPLIFLSSALTEAFKQKASEVFHTDGSARKVYVKTRKVLISMSVLPFVILFFFGPEIFSLVLGKQWEQVGYVARILSPIYLLRFINSPLSFIVYLYNKLKIDLVATIYLATSSFLLLIFFLSHYGVYLALIMYSINYSLMYLIMLYYSNNLSKQTK